MPTLKAQGKFYFKVTATKNKFQFHGNKTKHKQAYDRHECRTQILQQKRRSGTTSERNPRQSCSKEQSHFLIQTQNLPWIPRNLQVMESILANILTNLIHGDDIRGFQYLSSSCFQLLSIFACTAIKV
ncbi:hypothetical protein V6N13_090399 [Hibiscus sabdariffa]|uniref:Uncharacterized protein n=1 Tax=Hibiscus sabdariffa TaxID=183260 RepID=A0ABR2C0E8_9ROSI